MRTVTRLARADRLLTSFEARVAAALGQHQDGPLLTVLEQRTSGSLYGVPRAARCVRCGRVSRRVHSSYSHRLADLPVAGRQTGLDRARPGSLNSHRCDGDGLRKSPNMPMAGVVRRPCGQVAARSPRFDGVETLGGPILGTAVLYTLPRRVAHLHHRSKLHRATAQRTS